MTKYMLKLTYPKSVVTDSIFISRYIRENYYTLTKARARAIREMENDPMIIDVQISNPKYLDVWQVYTGVKRDRATGKYYWHAIRPHDTVGNGHYVNKDGSLSKTKYR